MENIILSGVLTSKNIENSKSGSQYARFTVTRGIIKKDGSTVNINREVTAFGDYNLALINSIGIGESVTIIGTPEVSAYVNKQNQAAASLKVIANTISVNRVYQQSQPQMVQQPQAGWELNTQPITQQPQAQTAPVQPAVPNNGTNSF